jgi:hypothetical protein
MSAFTEFLDSVTASMKDRVSNPLSGSFIIAWCVANFRLLLVVVGDGDFDKKLDYINTFLGPSHLGWLEFSLRSVGWPLLWALFYVFAYPRISYEVMSWTRGEQNRWRARQAHLDGDRVLTNTEATKLRAFGAELEAKLQESETRRREDRERDQAAIRLATEARDEMEIRVERLRDRLGALGYKVDGTEPVESQPPTSADPVRADRADANGSVSTPLDFLEKRLDEDLRDEMPGTSEEAAIARSEGADLRFDELRRKVYSPLEEVTQNIARDDQIILQPVAGGVEVPRLTRREATVLIDIRARMKSAPVFIHDFSAEALVAVEALVEQGILFVTSQITGPNHLVLTARGSDAARMASDLMGSREGPNAGLFANGPTWKNT